MLLKTVSYVNALFSPILLRGWGIVNVQECLKNYFGIHCSYDNFMQFY